MTVTKYVTTVRYLHFRAFEGKDNIHKTCSSRSDFFTAFSVVHCKQKSHYSINSNGRNAAASFPLTQTYSLRNRSSSSEVREALQLGAYMFH